MKFIYFLKLVQSFQSKSGSSDGFMNKCVLQTKTLKKMNNDERHIIIRSDHTRTNWLSGHEHSKMISGWLGASRSHANGESITS